MAGIEASLALELSDPINYTATVLKFDYDETTLTVKRQTHQAAI